MAEERLQQRLAAILAADVVGYARLIEQYEEGTRARIGAAGAGSRRGSMKLGSGGTLFGGTPRSNSERRGASAGMTRRTSHTSARSAANPASL